jgi:hypothetical protein
VEDRDLVESIYGGLTQHGLKVWYAKDRLQAGAEIKVSISKGLTGARFGICIISRQYNGHWAQGELFVLINEKEKFLPVIHGITVEEASEKHPGLINFYCLDTAKGIDYVVGHILQRVRPQPRLYYSLANLLAFTGKHLKSIVISLSLVIFTVISSFYYSQLKPSNTLVKSVITNRCIHIQNMARNELQQDIMRENGYSLDNEQVIQLQKRLQLTYGDMKTRDRISFTNDMETIISPGELLRMGIISNTSLPYGLSDYRSYVFHHSNQMRDGRLKYTLFNISPLHFEVVKTRIGNGTFEADIVYENPLRYVEINTKADTARQLIYRQIRFLGIKAREKIIWQKRGSNWVITDIR